MGVFDKNGITITPFDKGGDWIQQVFSSDGTPLIHQDDGMPLLNKIPMVTGWKYNLVSSVSNSSYSSTEEAQRNYDDSVWDEITVPHDWSIELPYNRNSPSGYEGGFLDGGDSWYRCVIPLRSSDFGKRLFLCFGGVYMESSVYVNGTLVKVNKNGFNPFYAEITDHVTQGIDNIVSVFVRNKQPSSRWYSGSGIYRNVYLVTCEPADAYVSDIVVTSPNLSTEHGGRVTTNAKIKIVSSQSANAEVRFEIIRNNDIVSMNSVTVNLQQGNNEYSINAFVNNPYLWDIGDGELYEARITLNVLGKVFYRSVSFGYRYFEFRADTGFWLNGKNIKIKGVSIHNTLGCLGAVFNKSAAERELDKLVEMGCNAVRTAHNPEDESFLDICARKGILVFEELFDCWTKPKMTYDYARYFSENYNVVVENTVKRDRNNPAVILWGAGNEIIRVSSYTSSQATEILQNIINSIKANDTTRPITMGDDTPTNSVSISCFGLLDVIGINYGSDSEYSSVISKYPNKAIFGSETTAAYMIRGDYTDSSTSNYDEKCASFGDTISEALHRHMDNPRLAGMFPWCGVDYIGEGAPMRSYPQRSCADGPLDTALFPKDAFFLYQSVWSSAPMIHIIPMNWDWNVGDTVKVWLYSNCKSVKLFVNGRDLGSASMGSKYEYAYNVPFEPGTLVAKGYDDNGTVIAEDIIRTSTGIPYKLHLIADKTCVSAQSDDLVFVTCTLEDQNGIMVPTANNSVTFSVSGGSVLGTDSGWVKDVENMRGSTKMASFGKILCVAKHNWNSGTMIVTASSSGLVSDSVTIELN